MASLAEYTPKQAAPRKAPSARTLRLAYLAHTRAQHQAKAACFLSPISLMDGVSLYMRRDLIWEEQPLDYILHFRGGTAEHFAKLKRKALIVQIDTPGLSGALAQRFGHNDFVPQVMEALQQQCQELWNWTPQQKRLILSSFGAGYAPLGMALQNPDVVSQTDAVFVVDGIHYGSKGRPSKRDHKPFIHFARRAAAGEKLMVMTHTAIQPEYASSTDAANLLIQSVGAYRVSCHHELLGRWLPGSRADLNGFHVEGYSGTTAASHIAQVQQLGRLWRRYLYPRPGLQWGAGSTISEERAFF